MELQDAGGHVVRQHVEALLSALGDRLLVGALTAAEVLEDGRRLAAWLQRRGQGPVAVQLQRDERLVVALCGVLLSGRTWLALDPELPVARRRQLVEEGGATLVLGDLDADLGVTCHAWPALPAGVPEPVAGEVAVLLYTSGSTGRPKGVALTHAGLLQAVTGLCHAWELGPDARLPALSSVAFDMALLELLVPLLVGARLEVLSRDVARDPRRLAASLDGHSHVVATPTTLRALVRADWRPTGPVRVLSGGEALERSLVDALRERGAIVFNGYGPAEGTICALVERVGDGEVTVGRPLPGVGAHLVDGQLALSGGALALGYHGDPELTAARFVQHDGRRVYLTGDRAALGEDGRWRFLGRIDEQVKIRGNRVEPGELEAVLRALPGVHEGAVVVDRAGAPRLVAFYVGSPSPEQVRAELLDRLPSPLVPALVVRRDALPTSATGKLDRAALVVPARPDHLGLALAPEGPVERRLVGRAERLLGLRPGVADDLFELGLDSLQVVELCHGEAFAPADVYRLGRLRALAELQRVTQLSSTLDGAPATAAQRALVLLHALDEQDGALSTAARLRVRGATLDEVEAALGSLLPRHPSLRTVVRDGRQVLLDLPEIVRVGSADPAELLARLHPVNGPVARVGLLGADDVEVVIAAHHVAVDWRSLGVLARELDLLLAGAELPPAPDLCRLAAAPASAPSPELVAALDAAPTLALPAGAAVGVGRLEQGVGPPAGQGTETARWLAALARALFRQTGQDVLELGVLADLRRPEEDGLVGFCANPVPLRVDLPLSGTVGELNEHVAARLRGALGRLDLPFAELQRARARPAPLRAVLAVQDLPATGRVALDELPLDGVAYDLLVEVVRGPSGRRLRLSWRQQALAEEAAVALLAELVRPVATSDVLAALPQPVLAPERRLLALGARDAIVLRRARVDGSVATVGWYVADPRAPGIPAEAAGVDHLVPVARVPRTEAAHLDLFALYEVAEPPPDGGPWCPAPRRLSVHTPAPPVAPEPTCRKDDRPSVLVGEPIVWPEPRPHTLADLLVAAAATERGVVHLEGGEVRVRWRELRDEARRVAGGLVRAGVSRGDEVVVVVGPSRHALPGLWGCLLAGVAAVPLARPGDFRVTSPALERLRVVWDSLGRPPVLLPPGDELEGGPLADARALELSDLLWADPVPPACEPDDIAVLLLTSGSTGVPKPVVQTHASVLTFLASYTQRHGFGPDDVFLNWLGLDHVAPLFMTHLIAAWHGAEQVNAPFAGLLADPTSGLDQVQRYRATSTFAPNFVFGLLADAAEGAPAGRWDLSSFDKATNGGESIVPKTARRFLAALAPHGLPGHALVPIWGMSETCSATITSLDFRLATTADADAFTALGGPTPGFALRIVGDDGGVLPRGRVGRLEVRGPQVTRGYLRRPDANAEAFREDGWFDTGDLGFVDDGGLTLTGRAKDVIIVHGVNYYSHEIEAVVDATEGVQRSFSAAVAHREPDDETDRLVVVYAREPGAGEGLDELVRRRVAAGAGLDPWLVLAVEPGAIPKTEIGKIQRSKLRARLASGDFDHLRTDGRVAWSFERVWTPARPRPLGATGATVLGELPGFSPPAGEAIVDLRPLEQGSVAQLLDALWGHARQLRERRDARLLVVTRGVLEGAHPAGSALAGGLSCLRHERPGLRARLVDLPPTPDPREPAWLRAELDELDRFEPEVAWRDGTRRVARLAPATPLPGDLPLEDGDAVVVTGGAGGVGRVLLDVLAALRLRVLLVGRRPEADVDLAGLPPGLELAYRRCELGREPLAPVVAAWDAGPLAAFFHLAVEMPVVALDEQTPELVERVLAPRTGGTDELARLAREHGAIWVDVGSVNELWGGFGVSAYAAACRYGEGAMAAHRASGGRGQRLVFTGWRDRGVTAGLDVTLANQRRGFHALDAGPGAAALAAALVEGRDLVIGPDDTALATRARLATGPLATHGGPHPAQDAFGRSWPLTAPPPTRAALALSPLVGELEERVAAIWREVLQRDSIGAEVSFFELGGHSLLLVEVQARLERAFSRRIAAAELFRHPTVRSLARHLGGGDDPSPKQGASRAARMKARTRKLRGRRRG